MNSLKVGMIQMTSGEDVQKNTLDLVTAYVELAKANSDLGLVVTPENSLFMRTNQNTPISSFTLEDPILGEIKKVVDEHKVDLILGSIPLKTSSKSKLSNAMIWFRPGYGPEVVYEKIHLFDVDVEGHKPVRESENFERGNRSRVLEIKGFKFGLSICYDLRFSELFLEYAKQEVDALLIPSAFLVPTGQAHWHVLIRARAIESQCYCLAPAQGGRSSGSDGAFRETYGHSLGVDPWGKVLIELDPENRTGVVALERANIERVRLQIPMGGHRRSRT